MELGEPDDSGRRRPVPIEGDTYELPIDTMITAVSQKPDLGAMHSSELGDGWLNGDDWGFTGIEGVWTGGDNINLGIATTSIGQATKAALSIHATLSGGKLPPRSTEEPISHEKIKLDWYPDAKRAERDVMGPEERLANPMAEVDRGITQEQALDEVARCFSCGKCFGCENCWMYCQNNCFVKEPAPTHGHFYKAKLEVCDGCKKCWEECPCGFIVGM
jgi:Pyruvate/2-oxoacid:ferredoxin oxidoreductase delta subunit